MMNSGSDHHNHSWNLAVLVTSTPRRTLYGLFGAKRLRESALTSVASSADTVS